MGKKDKTLLHLNAQENRRKQRQIRNKHRKQKKDVFKFCPQYEQFCNRFNIQLKTLGLQLRDVGGDGNCLFRSIADQIQGEQTLYYVYRNQACRHMRQNEQFYSLYLDQDQDGSLNQYLRQMSKDGEWGGNLELQSLSQCMNMNIVIHRIGLQQTIIQPWNEKKDKNAKRFTIHLAYFQQQLFEHYTSIRMIGDNSHQQAITSLSKLPKYKYLDFAQKPQQKQQNMYYDEQQYLLKLQLQQLGIQYQPQIKTHPQYQQNYQQKEQTQPFPNYPRNKKCKCGSSQPYKNCCYKEFQKRKAEKFGK